MKYENLEFENYFEHLLDNQIRNNVNTSTFQYTNKVGATFNICKWSNYLKLKGYKICIICKSNNQCKYIKSKTIKGIFISTNEEIIKGLEYDFVFIDNVIIENFHYISSKFIIQILKSHN